MEKKNIITLRKLVNSVIKSYCEDDRGFIIIPSKDLNAILTNITTDIYTRIKVEGFATYATNEDFDNYVKVLILETNNQFTVIVKIAKNPILSNGLNGNNTDYVKIEDTYEYYLELPLDIRILKEEVKEEIVEKPEIVDIEEDCISTSENTTNTNNIHREEVKKKYLTKEIYNKIYNNLLYISTKLSKYIFDLNNYGYNNIIETNWAIDFNTIHTKFEEVKKLHIEYGFDFTGVYNVNVVEECSNISYSFEFDHYQYGRIEYHGEYNNQNV